MIQQPEPRPARRRAGYLLTSFTLSAFATLGPAAGAQPATGADPRPPRAIETAPLRPPEAAPAPAVPDAGEPLDLDACVRIALAENPLLRAAREGVAAAEESVGVARAAYYPEIGFDAGYRRFDTHVFLPSGLPVEETTLGATDDWSSGLHLEYALFDSGVRRAESRGAAAGLEATRHDAGRVRQDIVFAVHQGYYRLLAAEAETAAAVSREARAADHLRLAEMLEAAGSVPRADVLRARVEHADARLAIVRAEGEVKTAQGDLATAMGLPADLPLEIAEQAPARADRATGDAAASLGRALVARPELAAAQERIAAARHETSAIEGSYGPRVRAEARLGVRDSELVPEDEDWSVGVALSVPLFDGFARTHRIQRATLEEKILEAEAEALADRIGQEVWAATQDVATAAEAVRQTAELRVEAEESLDFTRARYEAGAGTINDLLDAESTLVQAEVAHVAARLDHRLASAALLRARGDL